MIPETDEQNGLRRLEELILKQEIAARKLTTEFERYQDVVSFKNQCERTFTIFGAIIGEMGEFVNKAIDEGIFNMFRKMLDMQQKSLVIAIYNLTLKRGSKGVQLVMEPGPEIGIQVTDGQDGGQMDSFDEDFRVQTKNKSTFGKNSRNVVTKSLLTERSARKQMNSSTISSTSRNASVKKPRTGIVTNEALLSKETITKVKWDLPSENRNGTSNCACGCHVQTLDGEEPAVNFIQTGNKYFFEQPSSVKGGHTKRLEDLQNHDELVLDTEAERLLTALSNGRGYTKAAKLNPMIVIRASEMIASDINQSLVRGLNQLSKELADSQFFVYKEGSANLIIENLQKLIDDNSSKAREDLELKKPLAVDGKSMAEVEEALMTRIRDSMVDVVKRLTKNIKNMHSQYGISQGVMTVVNSAELAEKEAEMNLRLERNDKEIQELILTTDAQRMQLEYYEAVSKESANQVAHAHEAEEQTRDQLSRTIDRLNECERNLKKLLDRQTIWEKEDLKNRAVMRRLNHFFFQLQNVMISEVAIRRGVQTGFEVKGERVEQSGFDEESLQQLLDFFVMAFNKSTSGKYSISGPIVIHTEGHAVSGAQVQAVESGEEVASEMMNEQQLMTVFEEVERNREILSAELRSQTEKAVAVETHDLLTVQGGKQAKLVIKRELTLESEETQGPRAMNSLRSKDAKSSEQFEGSHGKPDRNISVDTRPLQAKEREVEVTAYLQSTPKADFTPPAFIVRKEALAEAIHPSKISRQEVFVEHLKTEQKRQQTGDVLEKKTTTQSAASNKNAQGPRINKKVTGTEMQLQTSQKPQSKHESGKSVTKHAESKQVGELISDPGSIDFLEMQKGQNLGLSSARCLSIFLHQGTLRVEKQPVVLTPDSGGVSQLNDLSRFASSASATVKQEESIASQAIGKQTKVKPPSNSLSAVLEQGLTTSKIKIKQKRAPFQIAEVISRPLRTNDIQPSEVSISNMKSRKSEEPPLPPATMYQEVVYKPQIPQSTTPKVSSQLKAKLKAEQNSSSPDGSDPKRRRKIRKPEDYKIFDFSILCVFKVEEIIVQEKRKPIPPHFLLEKLHFSSKSIKDLSQPPVPITPIDNLSYVPKLVGSAKKLSPERQSASPTAKKGKRKLLISDVKFDMKLLRIAKAEAKRNEKTAKKQVRIALKMKEIISIYSLLAQRQNKKTIIPDLEEKILDLTAAQLSGLLDFIRTFFGMIQNVPATPSQVIDGGEKPAVLFLLKKHNFGTIKQFIEFNELLKDFVIRKTRRQDLYFPEEQDLTEIKQLAFRQPLLPIRLPANIPSLQALSSNRQVVNPAQSVNELVTSMFANANVKAQEKSSLTVMDSPNKEVVKPVFKGSNFKRKVTGPESNTQENASKITNCLSYSKFESQPSEGVENGHKDKLSLPKIAGKKVFDESTLSVGNKPNLSSDKLKAYAQKSFRPQSRTRGNRHLQPSNVLMQLQEICYTERPALPLSKRFNFSISRRMHEQSEKLEIIGQQARNRDRRPTDTCPVASSPKGKVDSRSPAINHNASQLPSEEPKSSAKKHINSRLTTSAYKSSKFDLKPLELDTKFAGLLLPTDRNFTTAVQNNLANLLTVFEALVCKIPPRLEPIIKAHSTTFVSQHKNCQNACPHFCDFAKTLSQTLYQNIPIILNAKSVIYADAMSPRFGDGGRINFQKQPKV